MRCSLGANRRNILITGANGFIGSYLSSHLEGQYNVFSVVFGADKRADGDSINLDLRDKHRVKKYFRRLSKKYKFYGIIHLAANFVSAKAPQAMDVLYDNLKITESMVEVANLLKPRKIINFSSMAVYPNRSGKHNEESPVQPSQNTDCLYGLSKFCAENILDFLLGDKKIAITHLRLAQVYGKGLRRDRIIPVMLRELETNNTIRLHGKGQRITSFIAIENLVDVVKFFLTHDLPGIYNVGQENLSFRSLAERIVRKYGNQNSRILKLDVSKDAKFYLDTSKLTKAYKGFRHELLCV